MHKLLIINLEGNIGGAETSLLLMIRHLQNNYSISVACPDKSPLSKILGTMKTRSYELTGSTKHKYSSIRSLIYWLKTSFRLIKIIKTENPDIIHANSFYAGLPSVFASLYTKKKLVLHARDFIKSRLISRFIGTFCLKIIAISNNVKSDLVNKGLDPEKIHVINNGIENIENPDTISRNDTKDYFVFANIGQFVPWKKQINFLKASSLAAIDIPNSRFAVIGDDIFNRNSEYKRSILNYASSSPIKDRIDFWGWQNDMRNVWSKIDCLVHCAEREPFGRIIIEAMAHKVPVIAINSFGPGEIVQNGNTGTLVPPGDLNGLSEAMKIISQNNKYARKLANAGYERVTSCFTAKKTAEKINKLYIELLT